jgi:hypothetical protein
MVYAVCEADAWPSIASRIDVPIPRNLIKRRASKKFDLPEPFSPMIRVNAPKGNVDSLKDLRLRIVTCLSISPS